MNYENSPAISGEYKNLLCDVLNERGISDKRICNEAIDAFSKTEKHLTVDDFSFLLQEKGINIDKEYISLVLSTFSEYGFARELQFEGEDFKRYEHLHPHTHHDHFICIKCKKIIEFSDRQLERIQDALMFQRRFKPLFHKLEVYGICDTCRAVSRKAIPIAFTKEDKLVTLHKIEGGLDLKRRLAALGFIEGEDIHVIKNSNFGPIVLEIKGARFAIGRGESQKILVYEN